MHDPVTEIDPVIDPRWDAFVENHPFGWLSHLSGWKRALETSFNHLRGHYIALIRGGAIDAALPIYEVKSRITGRRLVSIPFATLSDPLVGTCEDGAALFQAALDLAKELGADAVEVRTLLSGDLIRDERFGMTPFFKHHRIELDAPLEGISRRFHRSCVRQRIARAKASGIEVAEGETEKDLQDFYGLYLGSRKKLGLPPQPYHFLEALWKTFPRERISLLMARKDREPIGGLMLFRFKSRVSAEFAVYNDGFLNVSPLHGLFWEAIQRAHREGYKTFDFGRTAPTNQTLMDFKNRWGTTVVDIPHFYFPKSLCEKKSAKNGSLTHAIVREVCKAAPRPLFVGLGNILYRHRS